MDVKVSTEESLRNAEEARCRALMAGDAALLADMVTDDLVHIHLTGKVDDKAGYLAGVSGKYVFQDVARGPLNVRVWGDSAVMVGPLTQRIVVRDDGSIHDIRAITTQTWQRIDGAWRQTTCHNAPVKD